MQIKEFEAFSLKDCLQQVRNDLGPDAVILETRKFRKGGLFGLGARDAVCIVAATGITYPCGVFTKPSSRMSRDSVTCVASMPTLRSASAKPSCVRTL